MVFRHFDEFNRLTGRATTALALAAHLAGDGGRVDLAHLVGGLRFEGGGIAANALRECGAVVLGRRPGFLVRSQCRSLGYIESRQWLSSMSRDSSIDDCLWLATEVSRIEGHGYIGTEHLALALARLPSAALVLRDAHVDARDLEVAVLAYLVADDDAD